MMTATNTRAEARKHLAGKWNKGALIAFCYSIIETVLQLISQGLQRNASLHMAFSIVTFIISVPISYGLVVTFMKLKRGEDVGAFDFLTLGFSQFSRAWGVAWNSFLRMIIPSIILIISSIVFIMNSAISLVTMNSDLIHSVVQEGAQSAYAEAQRNYSLDSSDLNYDSLKEAENALSNINGSKSISKNASKGFGILAIISLIAMIASGIWCTVKSLSLALSTNIAYDNENMTTRDACIKSQELMKGNKGNLFVLSLSFIGWGILACLTCGIGFFWLLPYINVSLVCFYEAVAGVNEKKEIVEE